MKIFLIVIILIFGLNAEAQEINKHYKYALDKRIKFYPLYYNALQLTPEQISEFEYITEIYNNEYDNLLKNNIKLGDIRRVSKQEDHEIEKILDKRQKRRYRVIKHLERSDIKKSLKEKNYYKLNPRMSAFGDLSEK